MPRLLNVPMIHSPEVIQKTAAHYDESVLQRGINASNKIANEFWGTVERRLAELPRGPSYRFYYEGYTGAPIAIQAGSTSTPLDDRIHDTRENQILLAALKRLGGTLETTEDKTLHQQTLNNHREAPNHVPNADGDAALGITPEMRERFAKAMRNMRLNGLHRKRSEFAAKRITATLGPDEIGILLYGAGHDDIISMLPDNVQVEPLDARLDELRREATQEMEQSAGGENKG